MVAMSREPCLESENFQPFLRLLQLPDMYGTSQQKKQRRYEQLILLAEGMTKNRDEVITQNLETVSDMVKNEGKMK